jgi:hypothetical protein
MKKSERRMKKEEDPARLHHLTRCGAVLQTEGISLKVSASVRCFGPLEHAPVIGMTPYPVIEFKVHAYLPLLPFARRRNI